MGVQPKKPGELLQDLRFLRFVDPEDATKLVQIALVDTGTTTADGTKIYSLGVGSSSGPVPAMPSTILPNAPIAVTAVAAALPANPLVNGAVLRAPNSNVASIWIGGDGTVAVNNGYELPPGESLPVVATDLSKFFIIGNALDKLHWIGG